MVVGEQVVERGAVRRVERDGHRSGRHVTDVATRLSFERRGEGGPKPGAVEEQGRECRFAELRFGDRGEHAGRDPGRAAASGFGRDQRHLVTIE